MSQDALVPNSAAAAPPATVRHEDYELIKSTVARNATDAEFRLLVHLANRYGLDPIAKEIWCIKRNATDPALIMTSRDGYLKVAQDHPEYEGLISFAVRQGDEFAIDAESFTVTHRFGAQRGKVMGAWARCDRRGRKPQLCYVDFSEYQQNTPVWSKYPSAMIQKVAEVFVLRRQFSISGLVSREELDAGDAPVIDVTPTVRTEPAAPRAGSPNGGGQASPSQNVCSDEGCGVLLTPGQADYSTKVFGRPLCPACQKAAAKGDAAPPKTEAKPRSQKAAASAPAVEEPVPETAPETGPDTRVTAATLARLVRVQEAGRQAGLEASDLDPAPYGSHEPEHLTEGAARRFLEAIDAQIAWQQELAGDKPARDAERFRR